MRFSIFLLTLLPKNLVSYFTGVLVRLRFPEPARSFVNKSFVKIFGLDMSEAEHPLSHYESIEDVFTRKLKPSCRPLTTDDYCAPCDGVLSLTEKIKEGEPLALQVKGSSYSIEELLFGKHENAAGFKPVWASTFYLAPHNYHRVHSPIAGHLISIRHIRGTLWPVNPKFLNYIPGLFAQNERLVFEIKQESGGTIYLVMVGALNVGRITTPFSKNIITNNYSSIEKESFETLEPLVKIDKGEEIGTFLMGSTVVLVFDKESLESFASQPLFVTEKKEVHMGESLLG
jgi:phosphatidylserine decarboxylase